MTEPYFGEIQIFAFDFNPYGWAYCNGATLPLTQNVALYSLLGVAFGGNGSSTFQLPNFSARAGCGQGPGTGLTSHSLGSAFGEAGVTLQAPQIPAHRHDVHAYSQSDQTKKSGTPAAGAGLSSLGSTTARPFNAATPDAPFHPSALAPTGGAGAHENRQPYLALNFCIALTGVFPDFS